jgi:hypothetical protein
MPGGVPKNVRVYDNGGGAAWFCRKCIAYRDETAPGEKCVTCQNKLLAAPEGSFDRFTVVFSGNYAGRPTGFTEYIGMSCNPFHPQGFGQHGEMQGSMDAPQGFPPKLGDLSTFGSRRVPYNNLPKDCKKLVLRDYKSIWKL